MKRSTKVILFVLIMAVIALIAINLQAQVKTTIIYNMNGMKVFGCAWTPPPDADLEKYHLYVKMNGSIIKSDSVVVPGTSYMLTQNFIDNLPEGRLMFGICAQDSAGNKSIINWSTNCELNIPCWSIRIDKKVPDAPLNNKPAF